MAASLCAFLVFSNGDSKRAFPFRHVYIGRPFAKKSLFYKADTIDRVLFESRCAELTRLIKGKMINLKDELMRKMN